MRLSGKINKTLLSTILLVVFAGLCYVIYGGLYYEAADDIVFQSYIYGLFNAGSNALPDTFGCFILLTRPLNLLHTYFPAVNWYDLFEVSVLIICLFNLYRLTTYYVKQLPLYLKLIVYSLCLTIAGVFFLPIEFTKTAIFLAGISVLKIYGSRSTYTSLLYSFLFFIALLIRIESGILAFLFVSALAFASSEKTLHEYLKLFRKGLIPFFLVVLVSVITNLPKTPEEEYYQKIRPYEFALTDFDRDKAEVTLRSPEDSATFKACVSYFFADSSRCNMAFFKRIGLLDFDKTPKSLVGRILNIRFYADKYNGLIEILKHLKWLILIWVVLMCWLLTMKRPAQLVFIINGLLVLLLIFISLWLKPEEHVICPALTLLIVVDLVLLLKQTSETDSALTTRYILLSILLLLPGELFRQYSNVQAQKQRYQYYTAVSNYLAAHPSKQLILNIGTWDEAHHKLFAGGGFNVLPNAYVLDGAILYLNGSYQELLKNVTGSRTFINQWRYFIETPGTGFVCTQRRMDMIMKYIHVIYHADYVLTEIKKFDVDISGVEPLSLFAVTPQNPATAR